jgi:hypothetical protein
MPRCLIYREHDSLHTALSCRYLARSLRVLALRTTRETESLGEREIERESSVSVCVYELSH